MRAARTLAALPAAVVAVAAPDCCVKMGGRRCPGGGAACTTQGPPPGQRVDCRSLVRAYGRMHAPAMVDCGSLYAPAVATCPTPQSVCRPPFHVSVGSTCTSASTLTSSTAKSGSVL
eukprot:359240-Chlamydomonas_euryale.AAC.10